MFKFIWENFTKLPSWVKWYLALIVGPNLIVFSILFYFIVIPWYRSDLHATITPMREMRDMQIKNILEVQALQNDRTNATLSRIEQHQSMMYQAMLNRAPAGP